MSEERVEGMRKRSNEGKSKKKKSMRREEKKRRIEEEKDGKEGRRDGRT